MEAHLEREFCTNCRQKTVYINYPHVVIFSASRNFQGFAKHPAKLLCGTVLVIILYFNLIVQLSHIKLSRYFAPKMVTFSL